MPITFHWSEKFAAIRFSGVLTPAEFRAGLTSFTAREATLNPVPDRFADLTGLTKFEVNFLDIEQFAKARKSTKFPNPFKSAIIAPSEVQFGYARMFQTLNDHPQIDVRVFRNRMEACQWVGIEEAALAALLPQA